MFRDAAAFNEDLSKWDTSKVQFMRFVCCERYCGALSAAVARVRPRFHPSKRLTLWSLCVSLAHSRVVHRELFTGATAFNADLSKWDTSSVTKM